MDVDLPLPAKMMCAFTILHCIVLSTNCIYNTQCVEVECRTPCYRSFERINMENDFILSVPFYVTEATCLRNDW